MDTDTATAAPRVTVFVKCVRVVNRTADHLNRTLAIHYRGKLIRRDGTYVMCCDTPLGHKTLDAYIKCAGKTAKAANKAAGL
jgi:hypothetical protein